MATRRLLRSSCAAATVDLAQRESLVFSRRRIENLGEPREGVNREEKVIVGALASARCRLG